MRNFVQLIGHAGNDPEVRTFGNGGKVARLNVATNESYKNDKGERVEETTWHRLVAWGKLAERIEKAVKKGSLVAVTGKLTNNQWEDKDGQKRYTTEVTLSDFMLMGSLEKKAENA
ncbi:MAG TPA: single-stranded DNA-binding protein [Bacteroidales bacterium]|nr:single-stranded DNA-binding protein [Bacteroidales bacterium]